MTFDLKVAAFLKSNFKKKRRILKTKLVTIAQEETIPNYYYPRRARSALGVDTVLTLDACLYVCLYVCMYVC